MRISLVIPTLGRTHELQRLLETLCEQTHSDFEVLIADQNPPEFLRTLLQAYMPRLPVHVFSIAPQGVSAARNALFSHITGDIVAFPDDDCFYAPHTLERVSTLFQAHAHCDGVIAQWHVPVNVKKTEDDVALILGPCLSPYMTFSRCETHVQFYRRQVVDAVGGFDLRFGPGTGLPFGCGEDTDYVLRALQAKFLVMRCPAIYTFHDAPNLTSSTMATKWYAYGVGRMALIKKHNMPLWFSLANVFYPLLRALVEGPKTWPYRWHMFRGRLHGLLHAPTL